VPLGGAGHAQRVLEGTHGYSGGSLVPLGGAGHAQRVLGGTHGYSGCSLVPLGCAAHAQRVLEGTQVYLKGAVPGSMVLWCGLGLRLATLHVRAHARTQFVQMCAHAHAAHALPGVHVLRSAAAALRAGKYAWGAAGRNACPDGTARIDDLTACQAAATAAGKAPPISIDDDDLSPKGCYSSTFSTGVSFNAHVTGAWIRIDPDILLLCAGTGATRPPRPRRANTCTSGCCHSIGAYSTVLTDTAPCLCT
jgi:hypothetical protein